MFRLIGYLLSALFKSKAGLVAENLCLRQQLVVLKRRQQRPRLRNSDRRFWILVSRSIADWRDTLIIVQPETVIGWHRKGWKAYWRLRSSRRDRGGRRRIAPELRALIRRMARDNYLWGQRRIEAELKRLGFTVCARTVAKYMRRPYDDEPSPGWRRFLRRHTNDIWACDLFTVRTLWFRTLYVFVVISHGKRELIHVRITEHPTAEWLAQQMVEACSPERKPPRYLIHDRDGCYGAIFNRRVRGLGITQIRTPVKAPKANAIAERWVRTARAECLDQRTPCQRVGNQEGRNGARIVARPVLGGLHHVYGFAA